MSARESQFDRFIKSVVKTETCWLWNRRYTNYGYGIFTFEGKRMTSHRFAYEHFIGPLDPSLDICHKCDVRNCVNPEHLYMGTRKQNMQDVKDRKRHSRWGKSHCKRGHEYTPENTQEGKNGRQCKACAPFHRASLKAKGYRQTNCAECGVRRRCGKFGELQKYTCSQCRKRLTSTAREVENE